MSIANRLREIRRELGETQHTFAIQLKLKDSTYANYEIGRAIPDKVKICLARRFGVNLQWLLTGEGEMFLSEELENENDFPEDPMQGIAYLDALVDLMKRKGIIDEKDIPPPLPGVRRAAPKMTEETRRKLQRDLEKVRQESEHAQREYERIKREFERYEDTWQSGSNETREPEADYESREDQGRYEIPEPEEEEGVKVPLVGLIAAGKPLNTEAWPYEWRRIVLRRGESPDTHYLLEVIGTSMNEAGISDGSLILIHRAEVAENGQIAVVYLPDEGVTLKRIRHNPEERSILKWQDGTGRFRELGEEDLIQGVFIRVINE